MRTRHLIALAVLAIILAAMYEASKDWQHFSSGQGGALSKIYHAFWAAARAAV